MIRTSPAALPGAVIDVAAYDAAVIVDALNTAGITGLKGAFTREWVTALAEDIDRAFEEAIVRPGGAVGRGPNRYYVEVHPEDFRGFVDLVTHPWVQAVNEAVLGPDYEIVEIGFDIPFGGAVNQPWHRDFPSPVETYEGHRLTSLAFNMTVVDVEPDMGPFEIAPGTQWQSGLDFKHCMFPDESTWPQYAALAQQKLTKMGDIAARSALTIHRGTANHTDKKRPTLVLGVDAPGAGHAALHDVMVTQSFYDTLPDVVRRHLDCRVVDELVPIVQKHTIEGLVMGAP
ncbi:MAG: phytanoyl-CoA dioxygenase family protein [Mycobacteriales bacterium]